MSRADVADLKRRLSDPREVARLLGCARGAVSQPRGIITPCPVHGNRSPSLSLRRMPDGLLAVACQACRVKGDVLSLIAAVERLDLARDFPRVLERAAELAGGAAVTPMREPMAEEAPRCPPELYTLLAERILDAGRLDGRRCVRDVETYLDGRGLLGLARRDGWAALPSFVWLLDIARSVCQKSGAASSSIGRASAATPKGPSSNQGSQHEPPGNFSGGFAFPNPDELLVAARLARWDRDGRLRPLFGAHRLVIPWRAPDDTVHALQRRSIGEGAGQRYVAPWGLEWPYGVERLRAGTGRVAIVEGAVDTNALGALYPRLDVVGIPGLRGWRASWARLFEGRAVRVALDRGKPDARGVVPEDVAAARIALDLRGRHEELPEHAERCVICGAPEPWLCVGCGRRRAPDGGDWGEMWRARVTSRRG